MKIFSHDTTKGLFSSTTEALSKNPDNPDAPLFSRLDQLKSYRSQGTFHFKLCYPDTVGDDGLNCNEWEQTSIRPYTTQQVQSSYLTTGSNRKSNKTNRTYNIFRLWILE